MIDLSGKTALVTGGAKRVGGGIAFALAQAGARVVIHHHESGAAATELARAICDTGGLAWEIAADLMDGDQADWLVANAQKLVEGPIDILINNAAIFPQSTLLDLDPLDLAVNLQVNAHAPLQLSRAIFAQEVPASIVNLLDCRIHDYDREHAAYHLSKRLLATLTRMCALEFAPRVRVNAVAPGLILPPAGADEGYLERLRTTNPLERIGSVEEVAEAVLFLLRSPFVTGQTIYVDGGRHLKGRTYE